MKCDTCIHSKVCYYKEVCPSYDFEECEYYHGEQPTGEWIPVNPIQMDLLGGYKCSVCGSGDYSIQIGVDKYCKFCGTKMKGGETNDE